MRLRSPEFVLVGLAAALAVGPAGAQAAPADSGSARWIAQRFFDRDGWPDRARWYAGEMAEAYAAEPTIGAALPPHVSVTHRVVRERGEYAVVATTLRDSVNASDWYAHLRRAPDGWKLEAVRTLWLPEIYAMQVRELEATRPLPDSSAALLAEMRLSMESDSVLTTHFAAHRDAFQRAAARFRAAGLEHVSSRGTSRGGSHDAGLVAALRELRVGDLYRQSGGESAGCTFFQVGGMMDNLVGYLHAPAGCAVPEMDPGSYILVEMIAPEWYLYRTT